MRYWLKNGFGKLLALLTQPRVGHLKASERCVCISITSGSFGRVDFGWTSIMWGCRWSQIHTSVWRTSVCWIEWEGFVWTDTRPWMNSGTSESADVNSVVEIIQIRGLKQNQLSLYPKLSRLMHAYITAVVYIYITHKATCGYLLIISIQWSRIVLQRALNCAVNWNVHFSLSQG